MKKDASALQKISRYCAYQERSHREVRDKLYSYGLKSPEIEELVSRMISEGFLNESRFARAFAGGKFRMKKWGRIKIRQELEWHGLTDRCIREGLEEIHERDYQESLQLIVKRKMKEIRVQNPYAARHRVSRYAITRGYEPEMVWETIRRLWGSS